MDFDDTPAEASFRAAVRAFLEANAQPRESGAAVAYKAGHDDPDALLKAKDWQAKKFAAGYAGIIMPASCHGRGGTPMQQVIYNDEEARYQVPRGFFEIGQGIAAPTLCAWGTAEQKDRFIEKALMGEHVWCQLFSEPGAGSDLAGLRTRATKRGDEWVINGQKTWTSGAHHSDFGILIARSDPSVAKHKGLTVFILDMKSSGISIRPIKQFSGISSFNEVFLTDVRIPDSCRLGAVGGGWKVTLTMLMNERYGAIEIPGPNFEDIFALSKAIRLSTGPALENHAVREKLANWYIQSQGVKYTKFRVITALSKGQTPGPENSIVKLINAVKLQEISAFGLDMMGPGGAVADPALAPLDALFQRALLYSPSQRLAGGTDEIMRNIIAERVLDLPAEPRADKDLPFNSIPTGPNEATSDTGQRA